MTMVFIKALVSQPRRTYSVASQSSSLRVTWVGSLGAEVFFGFDDAAAEELRPVAIDRNAGGERIFGGGQPVRDTDTILRSFFRERDGNAAGTAAWTCSPLSRKAATDMDVGRDVACRGRVRRGWGRWAA